MGVRRSGIQRWWIRRLSFAARGRESLCDRYGVWCAGVEVEKGSARGGDGAVQCDACEAAGAGEAGQHRCGVDPAEKYFAGGENSASRGGNCNIADKAAIRSGRFAIKRWSAAGRAP